MRTAYILAAYRTPSGKANKGHLKDVRPDDLAAAALKGLLDRTAIDPLLVEDVIMGCAFPEGEQGMNMARVAALRAGIPYQVPAQTVNRFCSSGLQTIASAAERIMAGFADCIIAGGAESMTMVPMGGNKYSVNPSLQGLLAGIVYYHGDHRRAGGGQIPCLPGRPGYLCNSESCPCRGCH